MNQCRWVQRLPRLLLSQTLGREPSQFVVNERKHLSSRVRVARFDGVQDVGKIFFASHKSTVKDSLRFGAALTLFLLVVYMPAGFFACFWPCGGLPPLVI